MAIVFTAYVGFNGPHALPSGNRATLFELLADSGLNGYTAYRADGSYGGSPEPSAVVVVIAHDEDEAVSQGIALFEVCHRYKELTGQQEVWVTRREEDLTVL